MGRILVRDPATRACSRKSLMNDGKAETWIYASRTLLPMSIPMGLSSMASMRLRAGVISCGHNEKRGSCGDIDDTSLIPKNALNQGFCRL